MTKKPTYEELEKKISQIEQIKLKSKKTEDALTDIKKKLLKLQKVARIGFLEWNLKTNDIYWSDEIYELYGISDRKGEPNLGHIMNLVHPDDLAFVEKDLNLAIKGVKDYDIAHRILRPDGKIIWVNVQGELALDAGGNPKTLLGTVIDITKRKQAELALLENQERMMLALDGTDQGLWEWDIVTGAISPSDNWCRIMGYIPGEDVFDFPLWEKSLHPDSLTAFNEIFKEYLEGQEKYYELEYQIKNKSGEWKWIWERGLCMAYGEQGEPLRIIGIDRDITYRNKVELELIALNKSLDKKVQKRTLELKRLNEHMINTEENGRKAIATDLHDSVTQTIGLSLSKIKSCIEMDSESGLKIISQVQEHLEQANREIRSVVYQLSPPVVDDFDIDLALGFLIEESNKIHHADFKYINNLDEAVHLSRINKITLYRAVSELINNILKHSGSLEAKIELTKIKNKIRVRVEDNGSGFDTNSIHKSNYGGFGLYSLSERLSNVGGEIIVNSEIGKGTKVVISIPANMEYLKKNPLKKDQ
jgi:PAS domain S-box-containing protein